MAQLVHSRQSMKTITRITAVIAAVFFCLPSFAKSKTLSDFISKVSSSTVHFDYSYTASKPGSAKMKGNGNVAVRDNSFRMSGNCLEVWCDGKTVWSIDRAAEEAVIESVGNDAESGYSTNPALLISSVDEAFSEISFGTSKFNGSSVDASVLSPLHKGTSSMDIARMKLFFRSGTSDLVGAEVTLRDGTVSDFIISSIKFASKDGKESFRFDEKTLGSSYVITDLR